MPKAIRERPDKHIHSFPISVLVVGCDDDVCPCLLHTRAPLSLPSPAVFAAVTFTHRGHISLLPFSFSLIISLIPCLPSSHSSYHRGASFPSLAAAAADSIFGVSSIGAEFSQFSLGCCSFAAKSCIRFCFLLSPARQSV